MGETLECLELSLLELCNESGLVSEMGWVSDTEFFIWVNYSNLPSFIENVIRIFGYGLFDDGSFFSNMRINSVCIDLCKMLEDYLEIENVFPKEKFQH